MTKKKRQWPDLQQKLERPWCYYCERDFDDLKILIQHQKAKHFKCERCYRRLNTAGGLSVHMNQVHKETLQAVENANPGRQSLDIEIFGMEGIPQEVIDQHNQIVTQQHFHEQAERAAATGNPQQGFYAGNEGRVSKRPKIVESKEDIKARLASFKHQKLNGGSTGSGDVTPVGTGQQSPTNPQNSASFQAEGSPAFPPGMQGSPPPPAAQPFGQQPAQFGQAPGYGPPQGGFAPAQQFPPNGPPYQGQYSGAIQQFGGSFQFGQNNGPPPSRTPPVNGTLPPRPANVIAPQGLPQRPQFGALAPSQFPTPQQSRAGQNGPAYGQVPSGNELSNDVISASVDELISDAKGAATAILTADAAAEKKAKKDKNIKLVYFDESVSPEEKLAQKARYAFTPEQRNDVVLDIPMGGAVTSTVST
ncbi:hypothetical protein K469DRAFT_686917 [Zopfia rhizophila CBS 207.26]|uniref:C2H2-type domain-containing protein n=1 Tax=Zopfia rhizophila CBS 207.26 TaxID=1314779 RepID=A0A6A6E5U3_9PEZI|nr:hypothetical protein K469DRAFT_686917 [Zopfia rhizophila CBS 207.26]